MTDDKNPKTKRKLMSVRPPPNMNPVEFIAARRADRAMSEAVEASLSEASRTGEWFGPHESGLDLDGGAFGPPVVRAPRPVQSDSNT